MASSRKETDIMDVWFDSWFIRMVVGQPYRTQTHPADSKVLTSTVDGSTHHYYICCQPYKAPYKHHQGFTLDGKGERCSNL